MKELKFNSQVCTTKIQSQRLLELGLKPETADMVLFKSYDLPQYPFDYTFNQDPNALVNCSYVPMVKGNQPYIQAGNIPAWSLHRLIELLPQDIHLDDYADTHYYLTINPFKVIYVNSHRLWIYQRDEGCLYDKLVDTIEWTIKNNFFNKEYLKQ